MGHRSGVPATPFPSNYSPAGPLDASLGLGYGYTTGPPAPGGLYTRYLEVEKKKVGYARHLRRALASGTRSRLSARIVSGAGTVWGIGGCGGDGRYGSRAIGRRPLLEDSRDYNVAW